MQFSNDYAQRVYAGVLGKIIGVYLGRPFEGASYAMLTERFGQIDRYVHEECGHPLIVTDDDISGTFTFLRALDDYDFAAEITPEQIGQTWLNYIIERKTILWWGGMGRSTEHTAYLRLKQGHKAPASGSIALNSRVVAEQIGAQIFIDGWGLINPGDPERAADFARRAASVSHDGEAIYGAQVVAALVAAAFVETNINILLDTASALIPKDSLIRRLIDDIREWHASGEEWRATRERIEATYGYARYGGGCHMVPNHALIILALLAGDGDFSKSLMIVNTCGWDTDCNSANVGAIMGVRGGLAGISSGADWRGPVADRIYLPTADGGRCITDAVQEAIRVTNAGLRTAGLAPIAPKDGARFSFAFPGSVQGFITESDSLTMNNPSGEGLRLLGTGKAATLTFITPDERKRGGYGLIGSPTLYPGQIVKAQIEASHTNKANSRATLYVEAESRFEAPSVELTPGETRTIEWTVPDTNDDPITWIGVDVDTADGAITLNWLTWDGTPNATLLRPNITTNALSAWVSCFDELASTGANGVMLISNTGRNIATTGTREWGDYTFEATLDAHMASSLGIAARVQGLERYYALLLSRGGTITLTKRLDGEQTLAQTAAVLEFDRAYRFAISVVGNRIAASLDGHPLFDVIDNDHPLTSGAVGLVVDEGHAVASLAAIHG